MCFSFIHLCWAKLIVIRKKTLLIPRASDPFCTPSQPDPSSFLSSLVKSVDRPPEISRNSFISDLHWVRCLQSNKDSQTWLQAMSAPPPPSITVEPDRLIQVAVSQVFGQTRLRFSLPLIFRETEEKLAHLFQSHPSLESEFLSCVNETETAAEFEASWDSILTRYYLEDNDWLQTIYSARQQWVPVFVRDTFYGELSANEGSSMLNSFFHGFVDASTTIQMLINQYEKAISCWREKEVRADYEAANSVPVMKTPSPMEKQAASLYTREAFMIFQEEFVESLANPANRISDSGSRTIYRVAKFGRGHTVDFDSLEVKAHCSCQMFEYSGIICRHVLAVFRAENVATLPSPYLLRRWTKAAKTLEEQPDSCQESLTLCYDNLRQEATKYVEEGAKSIQIYKAAMDALDEAAKKVAAASNKITRATPGTTEESYQETANAMNHPGGEKERTILELTAELERTGQRCQVYRANLLSILRDMEEHKFELSLKVQNARLSLKDVITDKVGKPMAAKQEVSGSSVESDHDTWMRAMERSRSNVNVLQDRLVNVEESALVSKEISQKETEILWSRVKAATALLTYLKSKATTVAAADLAQLSLGTEQLEVEGLVNSSCDGTYVTEMLKHVETVTGVMESLARRAVMAESEAAIEKGKFLSSQEEIQRKVGQIDNMSVKLEDMEKFALGTSSSLCEMRQRVDDLVEETSRQKQRATENEQELCRVRRDFESLKSYVTSLISVRETLVSSEKQFQTIERLFERLVAKTTQLESEKVQKEAEVQKLMEENVRLTALVDKKEAQLLAMNEQCKMMALSSI
ncbi:unnamed protein product [Thlaspi arvense]|uniref:Protein FAR1-RELATED SEQUENCE n=1 Tax=Thlaspi arvense TaxID=13288 RepID=A0AAU9RJ50_THLAR|nr:unnamed protein product [Thlaspi arvense]